MSKVQILLSTYNGADYIPAQIESILAQDLEDWELIIRDDGSNDGTIEMIRSYSLEYPKKIKLIQSNSNIGATMSFMKLISSSTAEYLMLCDQDDVWHHQKLSRTLRRLQIVEKQNPLALVYTDMEVVDNDLRPINASFLRHHHLIPDWSKNPYFTLAQSMAAGCSIMFTAKLRDSLHPVEPKLFQHDHWLLMHAAYYGEVNYLNWNSLKYRQHGTNTIGAHGVSNLYFFTKVFSISQVVKRWNYIRRHFSPAPSFYKIMSAKFRLNINRMLN